MIHRAKTLLKAEDVNSQMDDRIRRQLNLGCALCPPNRGENRKHHKKHGTQKKRKRWSRGK